MPHAASACLRRMCWGPLQEYLCHVLASLCNVLDPSLHAVECITFHSCIATATLACLWCMCFCPRTAFACLDCLDLIFAIGWLGLLLMHRRPDPSMTYPSSACCQSYAYTLLPEAPALIVLVINTKPLHTCSNRWA